MATAHTNLDAMPVVRELAEFDPRSGNRLERLVFNHRLAMVIVCTLVTIVLGYFAATRLVLNASFEKMIPQSQPYIKNYLTYQKDLRGLGNAIRVVVENADGDIFDPAVPRRAAADQRRADPDAGRGSRLGEVAVDGQRALDRGHRGGLPRRPGDAGFVRRLGAERRAAEAEYRPLGDRRQPRRQQLQVDA